MVSEGEKRRKRIYRRIQNERKDISKNEKRETECETERESRKTE